MFAVVLAPFLGQRPHPIGQLRPAHPTNLGTAGTSEDQQAHDLAELVIIASGRPYGGKLSIAKHTISRRRLLQAARAVYRICLDQPLRHGPSEQAGKMVTRMNGGGPAVFPVDHDQAASNILAGDAVDGKRMQRLEIRSGEVAFSLDEGARPD